MHIRKFILPIVALCILWIGLGAYLHRTYGDAPMSGHWNKRWWNVEVSAHFLNTLGRYHQRPVSEHWFAIGAPCVEPPENPCIRNGNANVKGSAVVSSERLSGEDVYASFPPGAMAIASVFVFNISNILNIDLISSLRGFNWLLSFTTVICFLLALGNLSYIRSREGIWLAGMATLPLLASVESMHSHHLSMWAHQVFQPILALIFLIGTSKITSKRSAVLGLFCSIACWIEWTGYLLALALSVFVLRQSDEKNTKKNFIIFSICSILGPLLLLLYYSQLVGLDSYFRSLMIRFSSRAFVDYYNWKDWFISVFQSYGSWLLAISPIIGFGFIALIKKPLLSEHQELKEQKKKKMLALLAVSFFILLENVLMSEHSIVYTFDRLKIAFALSFLIMLFGSLIIERYSRKGFYFTVCCVLVGVLLSIYQFGQIYPPFWNLNP